MSELPPLWEDEKGRIKSFAFIPQSRRPREYEYIVHNLPKPPANLFEIGCGRGEIAPPTSLHTSQITKMLLYNGYNLHGVDLHGITWSHPKFKFTKGNFLNLDLPEKAFDAGLAVQVISHIGMIYFLGKNDPYAKNEPYDENADYRTFEKIQEILKPGGIFIASLPIHNKFTIDGYRSPEGENLLPAKKGRIYDKNRIEDMLHKAGLTITEFQLYKGWNPKLEDKTITEMIEEQNYMALIKVKKPT